MCEKLSAVLFLLSSHDISLLLGLIIPIRALSTTESTLLVSAGFFLGYPDDSPTVSH